MTLEEAVKIINRHEHRGFGGWETTEEYGYILGWNYEDCLYEFEAIAIAEKYERDLPDRQKP